MCTPTDASTPTSAPIYINGTKPHCSSSPSCQKKCALKTAPEPSDLLNAVHILEEHNLLLLTLPPAAIQALNILTSHARQSATNPAPITTIPLRSA